jgi:hypothetical protein
MGYAHARITMSVIFFRFWLFVSVFLCVQPFLSSSGHRDVAEPVYRSAYLVFLHFPHIGERTAPMDPCRC